MKTTLRGFTPGMRSGTTFAGTGTTAGSAGNETNPVMSISPDSKRTGCAASFLQWRAAEKMESGFN